MSLLTSDGLRGTASGSGTSDTFYVSSSAAIMFILVGVDPSVSSNLTLSGTFTIAKSLDGGQTFTTMGSYSSSARVILCQETGVIYSCSWSVSSAINWFAVQTTNIFAGYTLLTPLFNTDLCNAFRKWLQFEHFCFSDTNPLTYSQVQTLWLSFSASLSDNDVSGSLTAYKIVVYGNVSSDGGFAPIRSAVATLSIPAAAQRQLTNYVSSLARRCVLAAYADVVSVTDLQGSPLPLGYSCIDPPARVKNDSGTYYAYPGTIYAPGTRIMAEATASAPKGNPGIGQPIFCWTTLMEAVTRSVPLGVGLAQNVPNYTALGL